MVLTHGWCRVLPHAFLLQPDERGQLLPHGFDP